MRKMIHMKKLRLAISAALLVGISTLLAGCGTTPPKNTKNICSIFRQYPKWYWEAKDSYKQWGVPINVSLAIIREESHFRDSARPERTKLLGFIPWKHKSTAYGYSQALDGTWADYKRETGQRSADRDEFGDAVDFVGWYGYKAHKALGIPRNNAYDMYLVYHEGMGGFKRRSYLKKRWLVRKAQQVNRLSYQYKKQLAYCKQDIPHASVWNLWLM